MNKGELIDKVAAEAGVTKAAAKVAVDTVFGEISVAMKKGDRVQIAGFGSFFSDKRPGRKGINPATGEQFGQIPMATCEDVQLARREMGAAGVAWACG